jgi:hypothetical protein
VARRLAHHLVDSDKCSGAAAAQPRFVAHHSRLGFDPHSSLVLEVMNMEEIVVGVDSDSHNMVVVVVDCRTELAHGQTEFFPPIQFHSRG